MDQTTYDDDTNTEFFTNYQNHFDNFYVEDINLDQSNETTFISSEESNNSLNVSSTESEESKNKKIMEEQSEIIYELYGKIVKPIDFKGKIWWNVEIDDPNELKKINNPSLCGISGIFLYEPTSDCNILKNYIYFKQDQIVKVTMTYNGRGYCIYMKNIINQ